MKSFRTAKDKLPRRYNRKFTLEELQRETEAMSRIMSRHPDKFIRDMNKILGKPTILQ